MTESDFVHIRLSRRAVLAGGALVLATPAWATSASATMAALIALEARSGARIGVAAIDTGNGNGLFHREAQRFTMCSTFKLSLAALILSRVDRGQEKLDALVHYDKPVLGVSPATTRNFARGMTVAELCEAAVIYSDNTAANMLLDRVGGPGGVTAFWRALGDSTSRLDDYEPKLNVPDGVRNTTTPAAMMANLKSMLLGDALSPASRQRLLGWMAANTTGGAVLRAGVPSTWQVGDKTGRWSSDSDPHAAAVNDLAIITPSGRKPILAAVFASGGPADDNARDAVLAEVGRILATAFA